MTPIPLFVEICAGTAAVSLRLHRRGARPPVSRMGSKAGYADTILGALGLTPGQGAERYLWAEADPGVRLLLAAYTDRRLAQGAAEIIRGWAGEEPRALWERLRAEGPCKGAPGADAREVARWLFLWQASYRRGCIESGFDDEQARGRAGALAVLSGWHPAGEMPGRVVDSAGVDPYEVARWLRIVSANRLINVGCDWRNTGNGGTHHGGEFATDIEALLRAVEGVEEMLGLVVDRADVVPPRLPAGAVVMIDPPYVGTTPYAHDLPRGEVVRIARAWREAGARVAVCEAEPIGELVEEGWCFIDIADQRRGQKRTFSKQQREVLTMSEPAAPGWRRAEQVGLFGGAR